MALKLLNAITLREWFISTRAVTGPQQTAKKEVRSIPQQYKRNQPRHVVAGEQLLSQSLYEEGRITSLTYANKLYKRLPNETMTEFHQRVLGGQ